MNRGARRLPIFGDDADRCAFLDRLAERARCPDVEVHAFALMPNHFHLLIRAAVEPLSAAMQSLGSEYTRRFNVKYGLDGALFRGRYRSHPVESRRHLAAALRYIHRNPCHDRLPTLSSFRWTSHLPYIGLAPKPEWLSTTLLEQDFSGDVARFRSFVEGDAHSDVAGAGVLPSAPALPRTTGTREVERALGVDSDSERELLRAGGRGVRNDVRIACVVLCREFTDLTATQIADRYGFRSASSVRTALQRGRDRTESDETFAEPLRSARGRLRPAE